MANSYTIETRRVTFGAQKFEVETNVDDGNLDVTVAMTDHDASMAVYAFSNIAQSFVAAEIASLEEQKAKLYAARKSARLGPEFRQTVAEAAAILDRYATIDTKMGMLAQLLRREFAAIFDEPGTP